VRRVPWTVGLVALAAGLRLVRVGAWDIGLDEAYSALVAARPLADLVAFVARDDFHPPLYYLFLHLWQTVAGSDEFWLRFPSVVFGSLAVWVISRLGTELADARTGFVAGLLAALSPLHIFHAQDLRMYALLLLLASGALLFFVRGLRTGRTGDWVLHAGFLALALYTHYGAYLLVAGETLAVAWLWATRGPLPVRSWMASAGIALLTFLPWSHVLWQHLRRTAPPQAADGILIPIQQVAYALVAFTSDFLPPGQPVLKAAVLLVSFAAALSGARTLRERPASAVVLMCTSLGALGLAALVGLRLQTIAVGTHVLIPRTLLVASVGYLVLLAAAGTRLRPRPLGWGLLGLLVVLNLAALPRVYLGPRPLWGPWRAVAAYVAERIREGDGIVVVSGHWARPFDFYFGPRAKPVRIVRYYGRQDLGRVRDLVAHSSRVWLVLRQPEAVDPHGRVVRLLDSVARSPSQFSFPAGTRILLFTLAHRSQPIDTRR
jgi:uncharacterized membrane protein